MVWRLLVVRLNILGWYFLRVMYNRGVIQSLSGDMEAAVGVETQPLEAKKTLVADVLGGG